MAGRPYIIKWTAAATNIVSPLFSSSGLSNYYDSYDTNQHAEAKTDASTNNINYPAVVTDQRVRFMGTYAPISFSIEDRSILFLGADNKLYYPDGNGTTTIGAQRAYFKIGDDGSEVKQLTAFNLNFGDGTDGIENVQCSMFNVQSEAWYDLNGRKINGQRSMVNGQLPRGIYIHNGKKVVIK